jgi:hypothetical protein
MSRCRVCPATALRGESGPTTRLSRAADGDTMKRHGTTKEYMFVNRRWRRRRQAHVGPGHGRRRAFGSPDREHGRDIKVADTGRDVTRRDPATGPPARDPARDYFACDGPYGTRSGDEPYGTRWPSRPRRWCGCPVVRVPGGAGARWPDDVLLCPVMPGYARRCLATHLTLRTTECTRLPLLRDSMRGNHVTTRVLM